MHPRQRLELCRPESLRPQRPDHRDAVEQGTEREERYILLAETTGSAATVCTTGAADFRELRSGFVGRELFEPDEGRASKSTTDLELEVRSPRSGTRLAAVCLIGDPLPGDLCVLA